VKLLVVHPGASWSVADLYSGLVPAFERAGAEVVQYALDGRITAAGGYLRYLWQRHQELPRPNQADVSYQASVGAIERALRHNVDWVFVVSGLWLHPDALVMMRRAGLKVCILYTESPYEDDTWQLRLAPYADCVLTNERASVARFAQVTRAAYYRHAIDPAKHGTTGDDDVPAHDVVFVGTGWPERIELLTAMDWTGIDLGLYGSWSRLGSRHRLRAHLKGGITPNARTAALYRKARVGLNLHRAADHAESMNPRCYELAACGAFFITDDRPEVAEVFGATVPTFTTAAEAGELIRYYLSHEQERQAIAAQLPALVAGETFDRRAADILAALKEIR
jgi:spore maturation protein CgeB